MPVQGGRRSGSRSENRCTNHRRLARRRPADLGKRNGSNQARTAYEALTADQKVYVKNLETLKAAEAKISDLRPEAEAKPVIDKMSQAIGAINEKSETALDAYNEAITAYNALSPAAKGKADAKSAMDTALNTKSAEQHAKQRMSRRKMAKASRCH